MNEQWQELKETITEMRDNDGTGTQQEVCKFLANYMDVLEKQMQDPCDNAISRSDMLDAVGHGTTYTSEEVQKIVNNLPPVTPQAKEQEPCDDAISRQYLLDNCVVDNVTMPYVPVSKIENAPPITQKSGHWIHFAQSDDCSECGWSTGKYISPSNYCPNCGAKMIESQKKED